MVDGCGLATRRDDEMVTNMPPDEDELLDEDLDALDGIVDLDDEEVPEDEADADDPAEELLAMLGQDSDAARTLGESVAAIAERAVELEGLIEDPEADMELFEQPLFVQLDEALPDAGLLALDSLAGVPWETCAIMGQYLARVLGDESLAALLGAWVYWGAVLTEDTHEEEVVA
jgi:hypothetical protein